MSKERFGIDCLFFAALLVGAPVLGAHAQAKTRQGLTPAEDPKQFSSPMILDLPLYALDKLKDGLGRQFPGVESFFCEDVNIQHLMLTRRHGTVRDLRGRESVRLDVSGDVFVRASYDRFVTLRFGVFAAVDAAPITEGSAEHLKAEEKKRRSFEVRIDLTPAQLAQLTAADTAAHLQVTVIVVSDK